MIQDKSIVMRYSGGIAMGKGPSGTEQWDIVMLYQGLFGYSWLLSLGSTIVMEPEHYDGTVKHCGVAADY